MTTAISCILSQSVYDCIQEREQIPTAAWAEENVRMPTDSAIKGHFRLDLFPQFREPLECFDNPKYRLISIQAASRNGKTVFGQVCLAKTAACNPHSMLWADADQASLQRVIKRTWRLLNQCEALDDVRPPERMQSKDRIDLKTCTVHGAYPRSPSTAADIDAWMIVKNEIDKWRDVSTSTEASMANLVDERAKAFRDAKIINISTPSVLGTSLIEQARLAGDNRARYVPCPHCNHFQTLRRGDGKSPGGVKFQKRGGKLHAQKAKETAYYECEKCRKHITEDRRFDMLQAGLWVPEGCSIRRGKVTGTPTRDGNHASFGPLSTLHSMLPGTSLGDYAENLVKALTANEGRREALRNHVNSWDGETYDPQPQRALPSDLVERLGVEIDLGIVPEWARFLTCGIDVGRSGEEYHFWWAVCAWGLLGRGHLVHYGLAAGEDELRELMTERKFHKPSVDGLLTPLLWTIDSGSFTHHIYDLCRSLPVNAIPLKGSSLDAGKSFNRGIEGAGLYSEGHQLAGLTDAQKKAKRRNPRKDLLIPNTHVLQNWLDDRLQGFIKREHVSAFTIPAVAIELHPVPEIDLPQHLLGDFLSDRGTWEKSTERQDIRDAVRYARVGAEVVTDGGTLWPRLPDFACAQASQQTHTPVLSAGDRRPDGRHW